MLEILLLYFLGKRIARMMRDKGRSPVGYVFMLVGLWIGGEVLGAFGTAAFIAAGSGQPGLLPYAGALGGAALGAITAFAIAAAMSPLAPAMACGFPVMPPGGYPQGTVPPAGVYPPGNPYPVQPTYPQQPGQRQ